MKKSDEEKTSYVRMPEGLTVMQECLGGFAMQGAHSIEPSQQYLTPRWTGISPRTSTMSSYEVKNVKIISHTSEKPSLTFTNMGSN